MALPIVSHAVVKGYLMGEHKPFLPLRSYVTLRKLLSPTEPSLLWASYFDCLPQALVSMSE